MNHVDQLHFNSARQAPGPLTDSFWLAAHDSLRSKPRIGIKPLGVGLGTGLLAEAIYNGSLDLRDGELFRRPNVRCDDPALRALLDTMAAEERGWTPTPTPALAQPYPSTRPHDPRTRADPVAGQADWPTQAMTIYDDRPYRSGTSTWHSTTNPGCPSSPPHEPVRHRRRGHNLRQWLAYLADDQRAEDRVVDRLMHARLVVKRQRTRLLGGPTIRYVVRDSAISGMPASRLRTAVQTGRLLDRTQLLLTGLVLATGLHHHALATLTTAERSHLTDQLTHGLDDMSRQLLRAADTAIGDAAMT